MTVTEVAKARAAAWKGRCAPVLAPLVHPQEKVVWRGTPYASAAADQHVENIHKQEVWPPIHRTQGNVYKQGGQKPPKGNWAVSLPSDDNKMRRTWYGAKGKRGGEAQDGQGTLKWHPKWKFAQDGPHWLGGYQDLRDPYTKEADSMCGHPVPGVNVYDWGLDKKIKHSQALHKLDKGSKSWYKVVGKDISSLGAALWGYHPVTGKLHATKGDGRAFERGVPTPFGEIMKADPISLLQEAAQTGELDGISEQGIVGEAVRAKQARLQAPV
mmetsp:Transcript_1164/g.2983  ORF Transcript_1164/g.2983 Transcript_1164/m.2983 type:complete len:270 (+) Transcript_1164:54-863(+)